MTSCPLHFATISVTTAAGAFTRAASSGLRPRACWAQIISGYGVATLVTPTRAMARFATEKLRSPNSFKGISGLLGLNHCHTTKATRKHTPTTSSDPTETGPTITPQSWVLASCRPKTTQNNPMPESTTPSQSKR